MLNIGASPPSGWYESCIELTLPLEASVVVDRPQRRLVGPDADLLALEVRARSAATPAACIAGVAVRSPGTVIASPATIRIHITANSTQPWRTLPTILPNV